MEGIKYASASERSERRRLPAPRAAPWLVIPHGKGMKDQAFYNLCEPQNKTCRKFIPEMTGKTFWQKHSHQGWLVILCNQSAENSIPKCNPGDCFLWNPVSLEAIQLPSLLYWLSKSDQYFFLDCVLSSPPKSSNNSEDDDDSMVFFLIERSFNAIHEHFLLFACPGLDKEWRTMQLSSEYILDRRSVHSLVFFKGKLYVMCVNDYHLEIEIQHVPDNDGGRAVETHTTLSVKPFNVSDDIYFRLVGGDYCFGQYHYVESCDELFMIEIHYNPRGHGRVVTSIDISRLDFSLMAWEEVKSLGDHVIFLGRNTKASCSAAELGLAKGCLFYTLSTDQSLYVFEPEDSCTTTILPCLKLPKPFFSPEWMMMPTSTRVVDGRKRRIEDVLCIHEKEDTIMNAEEHKTSMNDDEKDKQGQKCNEKELEEATHWGILTEDIVELIAKYVPPMDYIHFRAVCKANRSIIPAVYRRSYSAGIIKSTNTSPWLVISKNNDTIYSLVDPMHNNEKFLQNLPELLVGATIRFSKGGWLLMSKGNCTVFFYNPFTRETIQLPDLEEDYVFPGISFSSIPTSSDCVVFAIAERSKHEVSIFSIARGNDDWLSNVYENTNLPSDMEFMPCFNNPVFYGGAFYCLDYNGALGVFNLEDGFIWKVIVKPHQQFNAVYPSFLVECDGKLLLVDLGPLGKSIGIFRLDFSKMIWVKVESLGKHMLFISNTSCLSSIAPRRHMENNIYFSRFHGERILFYSLDTGRYHSVGSQHSAKDFYDTRELLNCTWIEPNWSQTTEQELDWLSI